MATAAATAVHIPLQYAINNFTFFVVFAGEFGFGLSHKAIKAIAPPSASFFHSLPLPFFLSFVRLAFSAINWLDAIGECIVRRECLWGTPQRYNVDNNALGLGRRSTILSNFFLLFV